MKVEKMIQPQQHGAGSEKQKHSEATEATRPVVEPNTYERRHMIEQAAYFCAESRGFAGGCPEQDWYEAEVMVDRMLNEAE